MIGTDGLPHDRHPHPRLWGAFPRVFARYWRERKLFSLEQAVHKMTGMTARNFRLAERGLLRAGLVRRRGRVRPAARSRRCDLRKPARAIRRRGDGVRQWRARHRLGQGDSAPWRAAAASSRRGAGRRCGTVNGAVRRVPLVHRVQGRSRRRRDPDRGRASVGNRSWPPGWRMHEPIPAPENSTTDHWRRRRKDSAALPQTC